MKRAILIVEHGSKREEANAMLQHVAELVAQSAPNDHVESAHMELAEPSIEQGFDSCVAAGATEVVVHPYMLAPGRHATSDIPRLVEEAASRHPGVAFRVTAPLGVDRRLAELIMTRVEEAS